VLVPPAMPALYRILGITFLLTVFHASLSADTVAPPPSAPAPTNAVSAPVAPPTPSLYNFTVNSLDGKPVDLGQYKGHVVLVVNTASHGGFSSQYNGLEKLYLDYKDKGFAILGFPSNDFGGGEPGTAKEIATFCSTQFHVTFPLFEKVKTRGDGRSPVYEFLTTGHGEPQWNFHKYLIDKTGNVIQEFPSQTNPESKEIRTAIEAALKG
jgi:glutathione peroxidase